MACLSFIFRHVFCFFQWQLISPTCQLFHFQLCLHGPGSTEFLPQYHSVGDSSWLPGCLCLSFYLSCYPSQTEKSLLMSDYMVAQKISIGIKHDFLCINTSGRAQQMLSENHVWSLLLHKTFFAQKLWRNCFKKFFLPVPIMARKSMLPEKVLKMPLPRQRLTSSLLCTLLMMTSAFMTAPECLFVKQQSRTLTAHELPCYMDLCWLKHGC